MASLKTKGDLAELKVATDLLERGYRIAIPYGEDHDFDLVLCRDDRLERVQVKYTESDSAVMAVKCFSHSLTNGRIRRTKRYTQASIEWLAVYDHTTKRCFYIPAAELGNGRSIIHLRLEAARNGQRRGIRFADQYTAPEITQPVFQPPSE
ncbi:MAG: group I intron-associated PD-(D/E)XK endonuclease [Solirubrobacterales bacterium]